MRDFHSDILRADRSGRDLPGGEFFWSCSTHLLFRRCPLAWFYTHYLAQGGWEIASREESCHAYLLKYLETEQSFLKRILEESLSSALLSILHLQEPLLRAQVLEESFQREVTERYFRALEDVENARYLRDPKYTSFMELHYKTDPDLNVKTFFRSLLEKLKLFFREFERLSLAGELASPDPLQWHNRNREYITFYYGSGKVVLRPFLYYFTGREFLAWKFSVRKKGEMETLLLDPSGSGDPEQFLTEKLLSAFCRSRYGEGVQCIVHQLCLTERELLYRRLLPEPLPEDFVRESSEKILQILHFSGGVKQENFPENKDPGYCEQCRFRALCRK